MASSSSWSQHAAKYANNGNGLTLPLLLAALAHITPALDALAKRRAPQPLRVLTTCGGPGVEAMLLCKHFGGKGIQVLSTDNAEGMVQLARSTFEKEGLQDIAEARLLDAMKLDVPDQSYDAVLQLLGPMLLPDAQKGFAEAARVLTPGGVFCALTPGRMVIHEVMTNAKQAVLQRAGRGEEFSDMYSDRFMSVWGTPQRLQEQLEKCKAFVRVEAANAPAKTPISSEAQLDELLQSLWENPGMSFMYTSCFSEQEAGEFRAAVRAELLRRRAESQQEAWGAEMLSNVACAWTAEQK